MLEYYLQSFYHRYFTFPFIKLDVIRSVSPNFFTFMSCLTGIGVFPMLWLGQYSMATLLLLLSGYCDSMDGVLARSSNQTSVNGAVYDIMSDRMVECAVILGLFSMDPAQRGGLSLAMLSSILICVTSFLVVGIFIQNSTQKSFYYSPGMIERAEAFIFFIAMIWLPRYFNLLASIFTILVFFTAFLRIYQFVKNQKNNPSRSYI
ncbi:MAG: hypothetical protein A3F11_02290 [Gammaproteobacteria bacterium RIFCSPHIGHO2_12_FULL_37_14]|nr:MAG: hypothetical protein A3F11_02290 [Gammaproteobacteria bacterium RIFCSPHIGHO2_12_FULL_37_14]